VAEFYAGVGAIGLSVLARAGEIRMKSSPHSLHGLELGLASAGRGQRPEVTVVPGPGARRAWRKPTPMW